jgi:Flp pilus assembly protein TadG
MRMKLRTQEGRRGLACVELALTLPLIVMLLLGIWEVGRLLHVRQVLHNAAREAGRQASAGILTKSQAEDVAKKYVERNGLPIANLVVAVTNVTSGTDPTIAPQADRFFVEVKLPFSDVRWIALDYFVPGNRKVVGEASWYAMRDKDFPSPAEPGIE